MIIRQSRLNVIYPRITDYRKKFVNSEEILKGHFQEPAILPIPDEVQSDVPRVVVQTTGGHSNLNIALEVATFATNYDEDFTGEWNKCKSYLEDKGEVIYEIVGKMTDNSFIFTGITIDIDYSNYIADGKDLIKDNLLRLDKIDNPFDAGCKYTFVYQEKYYININIENSREFLTERINNKDVIKEEVGHTINITIDVNDKYAYDHQANYFSCKTEYNNILEIVSNIINNKLSDLLLKGELSL